MYTSEDSELLDTINNELPKLNIMNYFELGKDPYAEDKRIPINLVFSDGALLTLDVFPELKCASVFGGYVQLSRELCDSIQKLYSQGSVYPRISDLIPFTENDVSYLYFTNHTNGDEVLCKNPSWSRGGLFNILDFYRMEETREPSDGQLAFTGIIGKSIDDNIRAEFYELQDGNLIVKINNRYYKPVKGNIAFDEMKDYLYNSTDLGFKN
jgi:hypothetical protein